MKSIYFLLNMCICICVCNSCGNKTNFAKEAPVSAVTIVNAISGASAVVPNFSNEQLQWYNRAHTISLGNFFEYSIPSGDVPLNLYQISDTTQTIFNGNLSLIPHGIYTLFLSGVIYSTDKPGTIDTLLTMDFPPYHGLADSVVGIRFVNVSPNPNPVNVNLKGGSIGSESGSLSYKGVTDFKSYAAITGISNYVFEFRDGVSDSLLASYNYNNLARFKNVTVVLRGVAGTNGAITYAASLVNDY